MSTERYLTPREVAEIYQVKITTVRAWLKSGKLKGFRIGGMWRIPASEMQGQEK
jgi:excisionase family DNA binding protein